jgi:hypothetical protein
VSRFGAVGPKAKETLVFEGADLRIFQAESCQAHLRGRIAERLTSVNADSQVRDILVKIPAPPLRAQG